MIHIYYETPSLLGQLHGVMEPGNLCYYVANLFSQILGRISVPLFFLISGYLFFYQTEYTLSSYVGKLKRRVVTLLIPYISWKCLLLILSLSIKMILCVTHGDWVIPFYTSYQFWFIEYLMALVLFSPLIFIWIRHLRWVGVLFLGILWYVGILGTVTLSLFFFALGASIAIYSIDWIGIVRRYNGWMVVLYPLVVITDLLTKEYAYNLFINRLGMMVGMWAIVGICSRMLEKKAVKVSHFLECSTFFVFACHEPLLTYMRNAALHWFRPTMEWQLIVLYFTIPTITILICLGTYYLLTRYTPRLARVLTGRG